MVLRVYSDVHSPYGLLPVRVHAKTHLHIMPHFSNKGPQVEVTSILTQGGIALAHSACLAGYSVLFTTAVDLVNTLSAAHKIGRHKTDINKYLKPQLLVIDELGYLPFDKTGVSWLFQVISQRYEQASTIVTSNKAYKQWPEIFNNDSTVTSAVLDRLLHRSETVVIEGKSFRMMSVSTISGGPIFTLFDGQ